MVIITKRLCHTEPLDYPVNVSSYSQSRVLSIDKCIELSRWVINAHVYTQLCPLTLFPT